MNHNTIVSEGRKFLLAIQFLTILPVPALAGVTEENFKASSRYYILAGLLAGLFQFTVFATVSLFLPTEAAIWFSILAATLLTGGLHEDGLADLLDGLGGGRDKKRILEIMRDSTIGTFGALGLISALGSRYLLLSSLPQELILPALMLAASLSRGLMVATIASSVYARPEGLGQAFHKGLDRVTLYVAAFSALLIILISAFLSAISFIAAGLAFMVLAYAILRLVYEKRLGGYTGDCLGATQVVSELAFLTGLASWSFALFA